MSTVNPAIALKCTDCGRVFVPGDGRHQCPDHGDFGGLLDVQYDEDAALDALKERDGTVADIWDYEPLLPTDGAAVRLGAGGTPLLSADALSAELDVDLRLKDERGNPTGSIKDRASAVLASRALTGGADVVTCASTGNAGASLAGYAARADLDCCIFVPEDVPEGKAVQPAIYGADVLAVEGHYDDAFSLCRRVSGRRDWYDGSAAVNPYAVEGLRTVGHELADQVPAADWVVAPMGNGCGLSATWKGLAEFERMGLLDGAPRLLGVQAEGASAIHDRFQGEDPRAGTGTRADSIDVGHPHNAERACRALSGSDGDSVAVSDEAILDAERRLGEAEGVYAEPASAATLAGLKRARDEGVVEPGETVVLLVTGTGLKDTESARSATDDVERIPASPGAVPDRY